MASRRQKKQVRFPLESSDDFAHWVDQSEGILVMVDVHKHWCGPTDVMSPTYERLYVEYEEADKRFKFFSVDEDVLTDEQKATLPLTDGCKPLFVFFKHRVIIGKVVGANAPELESIVSDNAFPIPEDADGH